MEIFYGTAACSGIAVGKIQYLWPNEQRLRQRSAEATRQEIDRFRRAKERAGEALSILYEQTREGLTSEDVRVFEGQMRLLERESFSDAIESLIQSERVSAVSAVITTQKEMTKTFSGISEPLIRDSLADIRDLSERLVQILEGISREAYADMEPTILVADALAPSDISALEQEKLLAFVTREGSPLSHTSIISRTLSIPLLLGIRTDPLWEGRTAIVDGYEGALYLDPDRDTIENFESRRWTDMLEKQALRKLRDEEDVTLDGTRVRLYANIRSLEDLPAVLESGARGIGLLRSEFQYLGRENYPREVELFRAYREVAIAMEGRQVIIRTLDIGADKQTEYMNLQKEENPILGNRGIRLCLQRRDMFKSQLRAIFRASYYGNLAIMYPMVTSPEEVEEIQRLVEEVRRDLQREEIPFGDVKQGVLVETPAAVMLADELAERVDFLSVGTNDLTQYVLAMDAKNPSLTKRCDAHHPAVLKMIRMTIEAAHRQGRWVGICGELAGDSSMTRTLLEMGADMLSTVAPRILPLRKKLREIRLER